MRHFSVGDLVVFQSALTDEGTLPAQIHRFMLNEDNQVCAVLETLPVIGKIDTGLEHRTVHLSKVKHYNPAVSEQEAALVGKEEGSWEWQQYDPLRGDEHRGERDRDFVVDKLMVYNGYDLTKAEQIVSQAEADPRQYVVSGGFHYKFERRVA